MGHPPLRLSEKKEESWGDVRLSTTFRGLLLTVVGSRSPRSVGAHSVSPREKRLLVANLLVKKHPVVTILIVGLLLFIRFVGVTEFRIFLMDFTPHFFMHKYLLGIITYTMVVLGDAPRRTRERI